MHGLDKLPKIGNRMRIVILKVSYETLVLIMILLACWTLNVSAQHVSPQSSSPTIIGTGKIESIDYSPDGREIAIGTTLGVELIDTTNLEQKHFISIRAGKSQSISYSPDGQRIAVAAGERIWIWNRRTDNIVEVTETRKVDAVKFGSDAQLFALLSDGSIALWNPAVQPANLATQKPMQTLRRHRYRVKVLAFSPNGRLMASGSAEHKVRLWDTASGRYVRSLAGAGITNAIAFAADSKQVIAASNNGVRVWATETGRLIKTLHGKEDGRHFVMAANAIASQFAIVNSDGQLIVWDIVLESKLAEWYADPGTFAVAFQPDGGRLITATTYTLKQWDVASGGLLNIRNPYYHIDTFGFSADSRRLIMSATQPAPVDILPISLQGILIVWDVPNGTELHRWVAHEGRIDSVRFSPDGTKIMSWSTQERSSTAPIGKTQIIRLWDATTYTELDRLVANEYSPPQYSPMTGEPVIVRPFDFNVAVENAADAIDKDKDKTYIVMTPAHQMTLWQAPRRFDFNRRAFWPVLHREPITRAVSKNGRFAATAVGKDIWFDFGAPTPKKLLHGHRETVRVLQFNFDGKYLVSLSWPGVCFIWNVQNVMPE